MASRNYFKKYFITIILILIPILMFSCDDSEKKSSGPGYQFIDMDYHGAVIEYLTWDIWELKEYAEYYLGPEGNNDPEVVPAYEDEHWVLSERYTGYGPDIQVREILVFKDGIIKYFYQLGEPEFMYCSDYDDSFTADDQNYYISGDPFHYIISEGDLIEYDMMYNNDEGSWYKLALVYKQLETFTARARLDCF